MRRAVRSVTTAAACEEARFRASSGQDGNDGVKIAANSFATS
jgi:hypothetical protein